jgi:hypothetical protein
MTGDPYRDPAPAPAQFVCLVCFKTATVAEPGTCDCSDSPRAPLADPEVVDDMRKFAKRRIRRRRLPWQIAAGVFAGAFAITICLVFDLPFGGSHAAIYGGWVAPLFGIVALPLLIAIEIVVRDPPKETSALLAWLGARVLDRASE